MTNRTAVLTATRDEILGSRDPKVAGYVFGLDGNRADLDLISFTDGIGFAQSRRTGLLYYVVQTGNRINSGVVRARAIPAVDSGDQAGTLVFDPQANGTVPGHISMHIATYLTLAR